MTNLIDHLPKIRGTYRANASLANVTWFQVGGPAEVLFKPKDAEDLAHFLQQKPADIPVTIIGVGSNLLVRDGGINGVTIRLGRGFTKITAEKDTLTVGAAALDVHVAEVAADHYLTGLEFLSGIPGTIGGALRMNAGAYGREIKDSLVEAQAIDPEGNLHTLSSEQMGFRYRHSEIPEGWIFTQATLRGTPGNTATIREEMHRIKTEREASQPVRMRTGGSTFANPPGKKAWQLIDEAGCRGLQLGGAQISEQHCNFMINTGNATAHDLETLGETVRERIKAHSGIELSWEIRRIGKP